MYLSRRLFVPIGQKLIVNAIEIPRGISRTVNEEVGICRSLINAYMSNSTMLRVIGTISMERKVPRIHCIKLWSFSGLKMMIEEAIKF